MLKHENYYSRRWQGDEAVAPKQGNDAEAVSKDIRKLFVPKNAAKGANFFKAGRDIHCNE
jgi:hypothetical protein